VRPRPIFWWQRSAKAFGVKRRLRGGRNETIIRYLRENPRPFYIYSNPITSGRGGSCLRGDRIWWDSATGKGSAHASAGDDGPFQRPGADPVGASKRCRGETSRLYRSCCAIRRGTSAPGGAPAPARPILATRASTIRWCPKAMRRFAFKSAPTTRLADIEMALDRPSRAFAGLAGYLLMGNRYGKHTGLA